MNGYETVLAGLPCVWHTVLRNGRRVLESIMECSEYQAVQMGVQVEGSPLSVTNSTS